MSLVRRPLARLARLARLVGPALALAILALGGLTLFSMQELPRPLSSALRGDGKAQLLDREGAPLTMSYEGGWNLDNQVSLPRIPPLLQQVFIASEDHRFYKHHGVDWVARLHAAWQDLLARRAVRGASTITEQVVRMLHPRPRTFWSRWVEGFEAMRLERQASKGEILEFYLNQVPFASNRRGVAQASALYFGRDLDTLNASEMLALAVLVRSPSRFDLRQGSALVYSRTRELANRLAKQGVLPEAAQREVQTTALTLEPTGGIVDAPHFVRYVRSQLGKSGQGRRIRTTLDGTLQARVQGLLDRRLAQLARRHVENGAALVIDHQTGEILSWVVAGNGADGRAGGAIDAVLARRQPGSALKPFLYAAAIDKGWTTATLIDDSPLATPVGDGLHAFRNYSRTYYGLLPLRDALANSLNVPAVRAIEFVGTSRFLELLRTLGFTSLDESAKVYGEGLALGNGEVSLLELVRAYTALAEKGVVQPLHFRMDEPTFGLARPIFSPEATSLIGNVLSDKQARRLEFGTGGVFDMPVQTATKTGTSTDYRDAWAVGYNSRYVVGVWLGNLSGRATSGVTGASGPAIVLRGVFTELTRGRDLPPLYLSPRLVRRRICQAGGKTWIADSQCIGREEWFVPGTEPAASAPLRRAPVAKLVQPTPGLILALDPRLPRDKQAFEFRIAGLTSREQVEWRIGDVAVAHTHLGSYVWPLRAGRFVLSATVTRGGRVAARLGPVAFHVRDTGRKTRRITN